ncbi:MAG: DUF6265 family protein [Casimicrobiaceae bacterium]
MRKLFVLAVMSATAANWLLASPLALAQTSEVTAPPKAASAPELSANLESLAWLAGCWSGSVNRREFREHWLPLRGGMMIGAGHTVVEGKTQDFEFIRLETRPEGVFYVSLPSGQKEAAFKLTATATDEKDQIFTFTNVAHDFPQRIVYRRGGEGWLYATIDGRLNGEERKVIYPMRRIDCQSGEFIRN